MPCLDEERYIEACLRSVQRQDYPGERMEILLADGGSTDGTRQILGRLQREDARIHLVENPDRLQAAGMNAAIRRSRGQVIVRMDVHCEYATDYVSRCVEALQRTGADNVGGAQRPKGKTLVQLALCRALQSPLGVGGAAYRSDTREGPVDTVFLGAFRRRVFETVGLYDPRAFTNEDAELNQRLVKAGGRVHLSSSIVVHYFPRESFVALARQYFRYGKGRARTLLKQRGLLSIRPALPFLGLVVLTTLVAVPATRLVAPWMLGLYALSVVAEAVRVCRRGVANLLPLVALAFPVMHVSHGLGFAVGLARFTFRPDWPPVERLGPPIADS